MPKHWKKGRGKLGPFDPLLGAFEARAETPMGAVHCRRELTRILAGKYLQLTARWSFTSGDTPKVYEEQAIIGADKDGVVTFWSFTSDGKRSQGTLADVTDLHPEAVGFEAQMDAGHARMAYWPDEGKGFHWVVESKTKKGWNRMVTHHYQPVD